MNHADTAVRLTGGELLAEMLRLHEVGPMFGMGGFQLLPFYAGVQKLGLEHYLIADERSGAWAADAYARASGRVGVCDATLGPGATNLITALVESLNAGVPVVALVGSANRAHSGKNMTQESEQELMLRPASKAFLQVESAARISELVRRAFAIAINGRPGPVVLSVPEDVCHDTVDVDVSDLYAEPRALSQSPLRSSPAPAGVSEAAEVLAGASRPVLLAGGGIHLASAYAPLRRLAEELYVPVAHTISGKGAIACVDPLCVGLFGRYSRIANDLIERADCLLAVGTRLGEIATRRFELIPKSARLIQLDCVPEEIGRTTRVDVGLAGDAGLGLDALLLASRAHAGVDRSAYHAEIVEREESWRAQALGDLEADEVPISVARLMHELNATLGPRSTLVADGGFASHWSALLYETKVSGRGYIADRGFASIGYGLPGALGARLALADEHTVVGLTGDGGLNMVLGELETVARIGKPLTLVVINNAASGYVKALQHGMYEGRYQSADLSEVDYARIAHEFGWESVTVDQPGGLREALSAAYGAERPMLVDVKVTRDPARMLPGVDTRMSRTRAATSASAAGRTGV